MCQQVNQIDCYIKLAWLGNFSFGLTNVFSCLKQVLYYLQFVNLIYVIPFTSEETAYNGG